MAPRFYPALDVHWLTAPAPARIDELLAFLDDEAPSAVEERDSGIVVFFLDAERRDRAADVARTVAPDAIVAAVSISDDAWAERSQESLSPIRVGRVVVTPPWSRDATLSMASDDDIVVTIVPSMGFGTGHHASTRLCLQLMQPWPRHARTMLDVGTGSGVLAIAAWRLGAEHVTAIDLDPDALASARENVELNGAGTKVELRIADLAHAAHEFSSRFDVVTANLTGAMLARFAGQLASLVGPGGQLIVSGFQADELRAVQTAFNPAGLITTAWIEEERWFAFALIGS